MIHHASARRRYSIALDTSRFNAYWSERLGVKPGALEAAVNAQAESLAEAALQRLERDFSLVALLDRFEDLPCAAKKCAREGREGPIPCAL